MHNPKSDLENETQKILWDFQIQPNHLILARRPDVVIINNEKKKKKRKKEKKRTCRIADFTVPADQRVKLKENEKKDKYLDLARELKKKLWNIKVTVVSVFIGALDTVTKGLETIQTTALLRSARILRKALETCGDLLSLKPQLEMIT